MKIEVFSKLGWLAAGVCIVFLVFVKTGYDKKTLTYEKELSRLQEKQQALELDYLVIADSLTSSKERIKILTKINQTGLQQLDKLIQYEKEIYKQRKKVWNYSDSELDSFFINWYALPDSATTFNN